jgi:hypothetical protein
MAQEDTKNRPKVPIDLEACQVAVHAHESGEDPQNAAGHRALD